MVRAHCFPLCVWDPHQQPPNALHSEEATLIIRRSLCGLLVVIRLFTRPSIYFTLQCLCKNYFEAGTSDVFTSREHPHSLELELPRAIARTFLWQLYLYSSRPILCPACRLGGCLFPATPMPPTRHIEACRLELPSRNALMPQSNAKRPMDNPPQLRST